MNYRGYFWSKDYNDDYYYSLKFFRLKLCLKMAWDIESEGIRCFIVQ